MVFNLVLNVKSYPEFVHHCREVRLLSHKMGASAVNILLSSPGPREMVETNVHSLSTAVDEIDEAKL
jgi:ribosome-associated toxin RatA of RatAB toxin-antitoxin module